MTRAEAWGWRVGCIIGAELGHELRHHWPTIEGWVWHAIEKASEWGSGSR